MYSEERGRHWVRSSADHESEVVQALEANYGHVLESELVEQQVSFRWASISPFVSADISWGWHNDSPATCLLSPLTILTEAFLLAPWLKRVGEPETWLIVEVLRFLKIQCLEFRSIPDGSEPPVNTASLRFVECVSATLPPLLQLWRKTRPFLLWTKTNFASLIWPTLFSGSI